MIKTFLAYTSEISSPELATKEILNQIDISNNMLANSVAIISCCPDLVEFGLVKEICKNFPFPSVGCVTLGNAVKNYSGFLTPMLTVTVLTSDDVQFVTLLSDDLSVNTEDPAIDKNKLNKLGFSEQPAFIISFIPRIENINCYEIFQKVNDSFDNVPIFGTFACDPNVQIKNSSVFFNGEINKSKAALIAMYGNVDPSFFVYSMSDSKIRQQKVIITSSEGCTLKEVNGISFKSYMETIGLMGNTSHDKLVTIPFIISFNDGTHPVTRIVLSITSEGYAMCSGDIPVDQSLSVGTMEASDILKTAEITMKKVLETHKTDGLIIFSCYSRNMLLGNNFDAEFNKIFEIMGDSIPYHVSCSAGEICPTKNNQGRYFNRLHNYSIIACVF